MTAFIRHALEWWLAYRRSLSWRIIAFGVTLVCIGTLMRWLVLLPFLQEGLMEILATHQLSIAEYVARDIGGKVRDRRNLLIHLAQTLPEDMLNDRQALTVWLANNQQTSPLFSNGLMVLPVHGRGVLAQYPVLPARDSLEYRHSDWFQQAVAQRRPVTGQPTRDRAEDTPIIVFSTPILGRHGDVAAVLAGIGALRAPGFLDLLEQTRIGRSGGFLLISPRDNLFVAATDSTKALTPLPPPGANPLHDRAMAGYRGTGLTVNQDDEEELSAIVSVPDTDWFLVARLPTREGFQFMERARFFVLRNGLFTVLVVIVFVVLLLTRYLRPLISASRQIHGMANGTLALQPVPVVRDDEVGELARGFNFLLERLRETTAQKEAQERLRLAEKEQMERSLRQWMADSSHELRTPIGVLRAQVEAMQDGVRPVDATALGVLHREVMGLSRLVDDLHTLACSDVGQLHTRADAIAPLALLDDTVASFHESFAAAGLVIHWAERPESEPVIRGDWGRLRQVFGNLLENSLRYTDAGGALTIAARLLGDQLLLRFDDTAPGVPPESLEFLFERFYRVDSSRSRNLGGSGIGLAVCRSIVEAHGGSIAASPSPLGGLRLSLRLPCIKEMT